MSWNDPKNKAVSGLFTSNQSVESLLVELNNYGVKSDFVNVLMSDQTRDHYASVEAESKAPEGASVGGISGGVLGGIIGGLTMVGSLLIPGVNLLVAGPIIGAIAGTAAGAATGGLIGGLIGAGIPEYEAKTYEKELEKRGNVLVVAYVPSDDVSKVKDIFKRHGVKNIEVQTTQKA